MFPRDDRDNCCGCYTGCHYLLAALMRPSHLLFIHQHQNQRATRHQNKSTAVDGEINEVEFKEQRFYLVPEGERHHERCHGQPTADEQWEDLTELGTSVHASVPWGQRAELHHELGWWFGTQQYPAPLQVSMHGMLHVFMDYIQFLQLDVCFELVFWAITCLTDALFKCKSQYCVIFLLILSRKMDLDLGVCVCACVWYFQIVFVDFLFSAFVRHHYNSSFCCYYHGPSVWICKWQQVTPAGQGLPSVYTTFDSLCLLLPCHRLHTLAVTVQCVKKIEQEKH